jgi:hypothetical protein
MIECNELTNKVIRRCTIYDDGAYGPEVTLEFTDGTVFSAYLRTKTSIEAKYVRDEGGQPCVLHDYSSAPTPR